MLDFIFLREEFVDDKKAVTGAWNFNQATFFALSLFSCNHEFYQLFV